jgi:dihydrofolate synthase/folylpolyglutamate synthase
MAFEHFAREKVDIAVLETGLGGRLDATNVVKPVLSVITTIGLDHAGFLGNTLRDVAVEKAGIIKPGRPVVCGVEDEEARSAIAEVARSRGSEVRFVSDAVSVRVLERSWRGQRLKVETEAGGYPPFTLPLPGSHQVANCATALLALETLGQVAGLDLDPETVRRGMESVQWAGRLQVLNEKPLTVLDCAHNPCGARALRKSLELLAGDRRLVLVTNFSDDKDARGILRELKPLAERAWVGTFDHPRLMRPGDVLEAMAGAGLEAAEAALPEALEQARAFAESHGCIVCIMGSVYLAGAVLALANRSHGAAGQIS